jgi:RNA 2',3'-cyclic 3'-phosphodiesterase
MENNAHKRLFFAIPLSNELKNACMEVQRTLPVDDKMKLVKPHNFHITVLYLGNVAAEKVPDLIHDAAKIISAYPTFELEPEGAFLQPVQKPKMVWIRSHRNPVFYSLYSALKSELGNYFTSNEDRNPIPHITLARIKSGLTVSQLFQPVLKSILVSKVELWESQTMPTGAEYNSLHTFGLNQPRIDDVNN